MLPLRELYRPSQTSIPYLYSTKRVLTLQQLFGLYYCIILVKFCYLFYVHNGYNDNDIFL